jgi:phage tail sheath protein FI
MRTYHTPGVYFERQDAAPPVIGPLRTDVAGFVGIAERGPLHTPVKIETMAQFQNVFGGKIAQGYLAYAADGFFANGGQTSWIIRAADPNTAREASLEIVDGAGNSLLVLSAGSPGTWGNQVLARWILRGTQIVSLTLHYPDGTEQLVRNPAELALPEVPNLVDLRRKSPLPASVLSPLVNLEQPAGGISMNKVSVFDGEGLLAGGADGLSKLAPEHLSGDNAPPGVRWGLASLEQVPDVSIVAIPDIMTKLGVRVKIKPPPPYDCRDLNAAPPPQQIPQPQPEFPPGFTSLEILTLQQALIRHCEKMGYRVCILDTTDPLANTPAILPEQAAAMRAEFDSSFAALYYPWILVSDPLELTGVVRAVPPSGAVAGIYAKNDLQYGVHKPPANEVVEGALDVRFPVDQIVHGELNDAEVNVLRSFAGRGIRVYGARTLSSKPEWRYINVRRLICMLEKAIDQGSQDTVFEPNGVALRREMDRVVRSYLETLFRQGMLDGANSDEAYFVKCNDANNPPEEEDAGRLICEIGVQPPYPAEFVVVVIGKTQDAVEVLRESGAVNA